ncbi:MAG: DNA topoisomerase 3 [Ruminococcus sp.]|nr:DNA topoisomerase 3 [Ruminococcus sp.]
MQLIVAEKKSVGETIAKVLGLTDKDDGCIKGGGFIVSWCVGHLVGLSLPDSYGEQYENYWTFDNLPIIPQEWKFQSDKTKAKQLKVLKNLMNDKLVDEIICATDAGREGECIFRYVYNYLGCTKPVKRLWISSMEDSAIQNGMGNLQPDSDFDNLYAAGLARAKADWLVGMNGSRLFSNRFGAALNIGRVQTPVLAMAVKRDYDISHFVKTKFFNVVLDCKTFTASSERIDDENKAREIAEKCNGNTAVIGEIKKEVKTVNPPKLYDLTTLQREANRQYGYTAKQTLEYTQSLYEAKLVTYPRTDSQYLTEDMEQTALDMVQTVISSINEYNSVSLTKPDIQHCLNNKKVSDHTAIIPTAEIANSNLAALPVGEKNILLLIALRLLLAAAQPYKYESVKVNVKCSDCDFYASGKAVMQNGVKEIEMQVRGAEQAEKETILPEFSEGEEIHDVTSEVKEGFTTPPKPYTEDTLLSAMEHAGNEDYDENSDVEKKGLGTPATRADIIENLVKREYIVRDKKKIAVTEKGKNLIEAMPDEVKSAKLTADWETRLQDIEKGTYSADKFMADIEEFVTGLVSGYSEKVRDSVFKKEKEVIGKCPRCGKNIYEGKNNYYCESGKEGCGFTIWKKNKYPEAEIDCKTAKKFLTEGKAELNTVNKEGKPYTGTFEMKDDGKYVNFIYCKPEHTAIGKCPKCGKNIYEYPKSYSCEDRSCGFVVWKSINGKTISEAQVKKLLEKGRTDLIKGFSKRNSNEKFEACLAVKLDYSVGFEFPKK